MRKTIEKAYCDICGTEIPIDTKPCEVLTITRKEGNEYGPQKLDAPLYRTRQLDLCQSCLDRAAVIESYTEFYGPTTYSWCKKDDRQDG